MSISIYYQARRKQPLTESGRVAIDAAISRFSIEELVQSIGLNAEDFNGESFCVCDPADPTEPGVVFEGATKLPSSTLEVFWAAIQYWCRLLTEIRRTLPDAEWEVSMDNHDIHWDPKLLMFDPSVDTEN